MSDTRLEIRVERGPADTTVKCLCGCGMVFPSSAIVSSFTLGVGINLPEVAAHCHALMSMCSAMVIDIIKTAETATPGTGTTIWKTIEHLKKHHDLEILQQRQFSGADADQVHPTFFPEPKRRGGSSPSN